MFRWIVLGVSAAALAISVAYRWRAHRAGALLLSLGAIAANGLLLGLTAWALVAVRALVVPREERELAARFGAAYEAYRHRTGALFPRMGVRR